MKHLIAAMIVAGVVVSPACKGGTTTQSTSASKPGDIDSLLAPVALYPDQLLAQMLLGAAEPAMVVALHTWLQSNATLKGTELQDAATIEGFDPTLVALTLFPTVVKFMAEQLDWTTSLGKAFAADRSAVFASIQRLRMNAYDKGALKTTPQQQVERRTTPAGEPVIVVEPANPQVIYVPQYDPQVVYTQPPTTTVVIEEDDDDAEALAAGLIGFTAGIAIGAAMDNDYYYGPYGWYGGGMYMYNDAWDDYYDAREDAREDWIDHREDLIEERGERGEQAREERTERSETRQEGRTERAEGRQDLSPEQRAQVAERQQTRQENRPEAQAQRQERRSDATATAQTRTAGASGYESRGYSGTTREATPERSGAGSDAFSGYSSGGSTRAASSRGQASRGAARSGGGGGRRR